MDFHRFTGRLALSGLVIGLYGALMAATQGFAFGQYQIRIATALYGLGRVFPFLVLPLGLANMISNLLLGGLGPLDMIGGFFAGLATSAAAAWSRRTPWPNAVTALAIVLIPGLGVALWLSYLLQIPYAVLAPSLVAGQILPGLAGAILAEALERRLGKGQQLRR